MFCPSCGTSLRDDAKFCGSCGNAIPQRPITDDAAPSGIGSGIAGDAGNDGGSTPQPAEAVSTMTAQLPTGTAQPPASAMSTPFPAALANQNAALRNPAIEALTRDLSAPRVWQTIGTSIGIGLGAAIVVSGIVTAILMKSLESMPGVVDPASVSLSFFQLTTFILILGTSGSLTISPTTSSTYHGYGAESSVATASHLSLPLTSIGIILMVGCAFGSFLMARRHAIALRWTGTLVAAVTGALTAIVTLVLGATFAFTASVVRVSGLTARTFFVTLLIAALGSFLGCAAAQYAPDGGNLPRACWLWLHRSRGNLRTIVDAALIYAALALVVAVVGFFANNPIPPSPHMEGGFVVTLFLFVLFLPFLAMAYLTVASFGAIAFTSTQTPTESHPHLLP